MYSDYVVVEWEEAVEIINGQERGKIDWDDWNIFIALITIVLSRREEMGVHQHK